MWRMPSILDAEIPSRRNKQRPIEINFSQFFDSHPLHTPPLFKLHSSENKWQQGILAGVWEVIVFIHQQVDLSVAVRRRRISETHSQCLQNATLRKNAKLYSLFLCSDKLIDKAGISITQYLLALQWKYYIYSCKYTSQLVAGFIVLLLW